MNTLLALTLAKTGLKIAKIVVKITDNKKDDLLMELIEIIFSIISKLKDGDFNINGELDKLSSIVELLKVRKNG